MKQSTFKILSNKALTSSVHEMTLSGDCSAITAPGQFVNISLPGLYLRRPISVCDCEGTILTLVYKVVGKGSALMASLPVGTELDLLTGLGNGFALEPDSRKPLLVGGGVGVPPMYKLCKFLLSKGLTPKVVLGFNTASEIFYEDRFRELGVEVIVTTVDGSRGIKGFVTDALPGLDYDFFYACGPVPMLRALSLSSDRGGLVSLEERMACGFGACV